MKKICIQLLLFSVLFIINSCNCEFENSNIDKTSSINYMQTSLAIKDTIVIKLNNITNYTYSFVYQNIEGDEYISQINKDKNICVLYNLHSTYSKMQKFISYGAQGLGQVRFAKYINWDSIFVIRYRTTEVYLIDSSNNILNKYDINNISSKYRVLNISANSKFELICQKGNLYLEGIPPAKVFSKEYWKFPTGIKYNIASNLAYNYTGIYPEIYNTGICFGTYNFSPNRVLSNDGKEVYSFSMDNRLFVYKDTSLLGAYSVKSKHDFEDAPVPSKKLTGYNFNDDWLYEVQRGSYKKLIYDQYKNLIYRIVALPAEPYDADGFKTEIRDKPFSIQIIDSSFRLIGEVDFPAKTYDYRNTFASKKGLLISLNNENNPSLEEDKLKLAVFQLSKMYEE